MFTPFSQDNQDFSDKAHAAAQSLVYPHIFNCEKSAMEFERASVSDGGEKAILDAQMGVDRLVKVSVKGLRQPIQHTVQERFRRPAYTSYKDITVTEWNNASGLPSELYKIKSGIFVYGYFDDRKNEFGEVIAFDVTAFLVAMTAGRLPYGKRRNKKQQDFITVTFDALHEARVVVWHGNAV